MTYISVGKWSSLDNVADQEGNSVGDYNEKTLDQCKERCNESDRCNSLAFSDGNCHLKDKCIDSSEPQRLVQGYETHYKECNCKINLNFCAAIID